MNCLSIGSDACHHDLAIVIAVGLGLGIGFCATTGSCLKGCTGIVYPECEDLYTVAMLAHMVRDGVVFLQCAGKHQSYFVLLEHVGGAIAHAGFRSGISYQLKAKGILVVHCRLLGVSYIKFYVVGSVEWEEVLAHIGSLKQVNTNV